LKCTRNTEAIHRLVLLSKVDCDLLLRLTGFENSRGGQQWHDHKGRERECCKHHREVWDCLRNRELRKMGAGSRSLKYRMQVACGAGKTRSSCYSSGQHATLTRCPMVMFGLYIDASLLHRSTICKSHTKCPGCLPHDSFARGEDYDVYLADIFVLR
jgi:hypothetical protein